ncbi:hypothetical protein ACFQWG_08070 [Schaalia naturae]|uniref:Uncharacterized protein n=1 Tax=Schaalia naturae TaxID=635203 RepID=A0ABW2SM73_9ACTO
MSTSTACPLASLTRWESSVHPTMTGSIVVVSSIEGVSPTAYPVRSEPHDCAEGEAVPGPSSTRPAERPSG